MGSRLREANLEIVVRLSYANTNRRVPVAITNNKSTKHITVNTFSSTSVIPQLRNSVVCNDRPEFRPGFVKGSRIKVLPHEGRCPLNFPHRATSSVASPLRKTNRAQAGQAAAAEPVRFLDDAKKIDRLGSPKCLSRQIRRLGIANILGFFGVTIAPRPVDISSYIYIGPVLPSRQIFLPRRIEYISPFLTGLARSRYSYFGQKIIASSMSGPFRGLTGARKKT